MQAPPAQPPPVLGLTWPDWLVLALYAAMLAGSGWWLARRTVSSGRDYFLAERSMPAWAVAISALATAQSAATFIGVPEQSYAGNLTYLLGNLGPLIAAVIVAVVFLPAYYRANVASPYELLEARFGASARVASSWTYLLGRMLASGARTYIGALPLSLAVFGDVSLVHVCWSIALIVAIATIYTLAGGIRSVIWTDVLQVSVYMGAAIAAVVVLLWMIPASPGEVFAALREADKLRVLDVGVSSAGVEWSKGFTLLTALTGLMLINLAAFATDQDLVQRSLTCKSAAHAARSVLLATLLGIPVGLIFLAIGALLFVFYQRPDLMGIAPDAGAAAPQQAKDVFQTFILTQMPPGVRGLMIAGVLAIGPLGINATLNSMASTLIADTYNKLVPVRDARTDVRAGRIATVACGGALLLTSLLCALWHTRAGGTLIDFALGIMVFAYSGLLAVFLVALLTRRGSAASAVAALVTGLVLTAVLQPPALRWLLGDDTSAWPRWLQPFASLAGPWRMVLGTGVALLVCMLAAPKRTPTSHARPAPPAPPTPPTPPSATP